MLTRVLNFFNCCSGDVSRTLSLTSGLIISGSNFIYFTSSYSSISGVPISPTGCGSTITGGFLSGSLSSFSYKNIVPSLVPFGNTVTDTGYIMRRSFPW
ncbi:unnamed protein product [Bacillus phage SPP1]|uniref:Bacteriophage SPP1 complete nucleotide sequence n=1 Tax=Bacillus phage SPP1 TaxID=10724 RepID=O48467_BPSPP|nr:hypothetical protein SPP1p046 [Bacillus phage SPP1]CAA66568.1 unnamed protein product [Bacillus phage SPP1]